MRALVLVAALGCGDAGAPPSAKAVSSTPAGGSGERVATTAASSSPALPGTSGSSATAAMPPIPGLPSTPNILALRHQAGFEAYALWRIGEDQYFHKQTLTLVVMAAPAAADAHKTCRSFDYSGRAQLVCAVHGAVPSDAGGIVELPSDLVPETPAGRNAALDVLCIDLALRASSKRWARALSPAPRGRVLEETDYATAHVFVTIDKATGRLTPLASRPWPTPCSATWEKPGFRPDLSHLSPDTWLLVWDRA